LYPLNTAAASGTWPAVEVGDSGQATPLADPLEALSRLRQRGGGGRRIAADSPQAR
jgi:hypothetical protein